MTIRHLLFSGCVAAVLAWAAPSHAQQATDTATRLNGEHMMSDVVVTGQYKSNSVDNAVQRIRVTDRKKIDAMNAQNLRDVLTNDLNIRLGQDNILGSSMSMQGISGQNVKILVDGVPVIGRQNGNIDLSQINLNNIERIEIVEGPMSVNYGTDALAGTINLITRKTQQSTLEGSYNAYYETIGTYNTSLRAGLRKGRHAASLAAGRNFFDGWTDAERSTPNFSAATADSTRVQQWKPRCQYFGDAQYTYTAHNTSLTYKLAAFNEMIINRGAPRMPYGESAFDDEYHTKRLDNAVFANAKVMKGNLNILAAYNDYARMKNTYYNDLTTLSRTLSTNSGDQDTSRFHAFNSRASYSTDRTGKRANYEAGYDLKYEDAVGARIKDSKQTMGDYALFTSAEYSPFSRFTIRPGLRYGYNTSYSAPLIPSLNLRYKVGSSLTLRASYARGFRAPSLKDLYFYFVDINHNIKGSDQLKAEYSDNYSVSAVNSGKSGRYGYKAEVNTFYNDIKDLITLALLSGTEYTYTNIGKYVTKGVQGNVEGSTGKLKLSIGGSYTGIYNELSETTSAEAFSYINEIRASIFYEWEKAGLTVAAFYKRTGRLPQYMQDASGNTIQTFTGAYNTADISIAKRLAADRVTIGAGCKNLFDVKNVASFATGGAHTGSSGSIPVACGRLFFLRTDVNLKKK